ncbi:MAG TPA: hypothetical protein VKR06_25145 [Ktedonosporobacter sp.]|nr:hypothetical protein [Ktedonosporobacter sp.]
MSTQINQPDLSLARIAWSVLEPAHAVIYFAPEARQAFTELGLKGYWMGYFASRSAPLGPVPASIVTATFYNFHPAMVARSIPDAWHRASPERITETRLLAADTVLHRLLGELLDSAELAEAASLAKEAAQSAPIIGRALFAAYSQLPWPTEPHLVLWHAATLLREFRGDGHVTSLLTAGIDGIEAHLLLIGTGRTTRESVQPARGWSDEEWEAAAQRLQQRGLLDAAGRLTPAGQQLHQAIEDRTDLLALSPWQHLGAEQYARLIELARPLSARIVEQSGFPLINPMGLQRL